MAQIEVHSAVVKVAQPSVVLEVVIIEVVDQAVQLVVLVVAVVAVA
jgi:hypothetical protein